MPQNLQAIEAAAFAAWPSSSSTDVKGWQLRLDHGYTKRANSLNATEASRPLIAGDLEAIEARFRQRGLVPTVRLTSFAPVQSVDQLLEQRGYLRRERSLVMTRALVSTDSDGSESLRAAESADQWLSLFQALSGKDASTQPHHLAIFQRIQHPAAWATVPASGPPRAAGLAVLVDTHLGLFDIVTHPAHQRQGLAQQLCQGLMSWGHRQGARTGFLQVAADNLAAVRLYQKLGFTPAYEYWYRVLP